MLQDTFTYEYNDRDYKVEIYLDENPDLSYFGEYTDNPSQSDWEYNLVIDRFPDQNVVHSGEYQYFVGARNLDNEAMQLKKLGYSKHECYTLPRKYARQDYERMEAYNRGDWCMVGIVISDPYNGSDDPSVSLWGIESDSGDDYINETIEELIRQYIVECGGPVDIIASGYEWICPLCGEYNHEIEYMEKVECCAEFKTDHPNHAYS